MSTTSARPTTSALSQPSQQAIVGSSGKIPKEVTQLLHDTFGFDQFRPGQAAVISSLLAGRSTLAIFPTGSGKSLCYQLPALALNGLTVVISPLIALMKDQIDYLQQRAICAARLDSSLSRDETLQVYDNLRSGQTRILYVSPERLGNERFLHLLERQTISLLAVDEAHCISEWGHNFRPDYLRIATLARRLKIVRILALTATATPEVAQDIVHSFAIAKADVVHTGFYRANLHLRATPCENSNRRDLLVSRLRERLQSTKQQSTGQQSTGQQSIGPTIVYVTLQRTAMELAAYLASLSFPARAYHAGLKPEMRTEIQEAFMASDEMIVVATIAFGMGIDKANIRAVYHYNLPKSLESYMQEIGRAGRDGQRAVCELLACGDDIVKLENFTYGDTPAKETVQALVEQLLCAGLSSANGTFDVSVYDLSGQYDVRDLVIKTLLTYLELAEILHATGPFYTQFKLQPQRPLAEIIGAYDTPRAEFLKNVFRTARKGKTWFTLDAGQAALSLDEPRERIVAAIGYLEEQGELLVQATGIRQGYRLLRQPGDPEKLISKLAERFLQREQHDIARVRDVVGLAETDGCLTRHLLAYFGEERANCEHCDRCERGGRCEGQPTRTLPVSTSSSLSEDQRKAIARVQDEGHGALSTGRQLARFLCGIASPATSRAKLRNHAQFGLLSHVPFAKVLAVLKES